MNDRFKFRAFSKKENRMIREVGILPPFFKPPNEKDGMWNYKTRMGWRIIPTNTIQYILMQCTGLKDKNGKLIYEGDVLKLKGFSNPEHHQVMFDTGGFHLFYPNCYVVIRIKYTKDSEIVGNIHENPELLSLK